LPRAAISTSREWAAIGEVAPLLLAAGIPKAPHLRIHTRNTNRLTALIPRLSAVRSYATTIEPMGRLGHSTAKASLLYQQQVSGRDVEIAEALSRLARAGNCTFRLTNRTVRLTNRAEGRAAFCGFSQAKPLRVALSYVTNRAVRPARAPAWLPTPARQRARAASTTLHRFANDILKECRADPAKDAPLVRALIAATDPLTQKRLSDKDIADELIFFLFAAHDNHRYDSHICNVAAGAPSGDSASRRHGGRSVPRRGTDARRCFAAAVHGASAEGGVAVVPSGPHWNTNGNPRYRDRGVCRTVVLGTRIDLRLLPYFDLRLLLLREWIIGTGWGARLVAVSVGARVDTRRASDWPVQAPRHRFTNHHASHQQRERILSIAVPRIREDAFP
jgi:hypothetical protein